MHWLLELAVSLLTGNWSHRHYDDRSIVGKSRMDRDAERMEAGCGAIVLLLFIGWAVARWQNWL
jgi:hypothetical protein